MKEHTVQSFSDDLNNLSQEVLHLGQAVTIQLQRAIHALIERDRELAYQVINGDSSLDEKQRSIDYQVVKLLALRQPLSEDLRDIISALRCGIDLERMGDYSVNIAKRSLLLLEEHEIDPIHSLPHMAEMVQKLLKAVLKAFRDKNAQDAERIWRRDDDLDNAYDVLFRVGLTYMMEDPRTIRSCTHFLFIAKNFERIGDHIHNMAENIYYQVHGESLKQTTSGKKISRKLVKRT